MTSTLDHIEATLMFTDIVGYSQLMGTNQALTIAMVEEYRAILLKEIEHHQGSIVEFIGDAVFARFDSPQQGLDAAAAIQKAIFAYNHFRDKNLPELHTRIGLHSGKAATINGALFGDDVNIAARLEPIAYTDGICISEAVHKVTAKNNRWPTLALGVQSLKNIDARTRAWLVRPAGINYKVRLHYWSQNINRQLGAYRYAIASVFLLCILAAWYYVPRLLIPGYDANYVEIKEFEHTLTEATEEAYLNVGITENVRAQLADMRNLYVVNADKGVQAPIILEGNVKREGDNIHIAYRILKRDGMRSIANGSFSGPFNKIFVLEDQLVADITRNLAEEFGIPYLRPVKAQATESVTAYDYFLQGLEFLSRPTSHENSDKAINSFSTALIHDKNFALAEAGLCQAYRKKYLKTISENWLTNAEEHCIKALNLDPDLPKAIESMGLIYSERGQHELAIKMLSEVLKNDPENMKASKALADVYSDTGEYELAIETMHNAVALQPENWEGYSMLGYLYLTNNRLNEAVDAYKLVLNITPNNSLVLNNLGVSYMYLGEFSKAKKYYQLAVDITPNSWSYSNVGLMDYYNRDYISASEMFSKAIELSPDDYYYYLNLADTLRKIPNKEQQATRYYITATKLIHSAMNLNAEDAATLAFLANAQFNLDKKEQAIATLKKALSINENDLDVLMIKARIETETGEYDNAKKTVKKMLAMGYSPILITNDPDLEDLMTVPGIKNSLASN